MKKEEEEEEKEEAGRRGRSQAKKKKPGEEEEEGRRGRRIEGLPMHCTIIPHLRRKSFKRSAALASVKNPGL